MCLIERCADYVLLKPWNIQMQSSWKNGKNSVYVS